MPSQKGAIIVITGGSGLGKSTLTKLLAEHFDAEYILEGEEKDFPARVIEGFKKDDRELELGMFFRNKRIQDYLTAMDLKSQGQVVFLDTFWMTNDIYTQVCIMDDFEKQLMQEVAQLDKKTYPLPDCLICLSANDQTILDFVAKRGRSYENNEKITQRYLDLNHTHEQFFKGHNLPNTEFVDRSNLDFFQTEDLEKVIKLVEKHL